MAGQIITRDEAKAQGLKRYFTGIECSRGHVAERKVASYNCLVCDNERSVARRQADPDKARRRDKDWRNANREKLLSAQERYRDKHRDERNAATRQRRSQPGPQRDAYLARKADAHERRRDEEIAYRKRRYAEHRKRLREQARALYWADRENQILRAKKWAQANREKVNEYNKNWRKARLERDPSYRAAERNYQKRYYYEKPNKTAAIHKRRSQKKGSSGAHTAADLAAILKLQRHRCAYCRIDLRKARRHVDHIEPLARGGSNDRTNIQLLCAPCNMSKGARDPVEFAQGLGRLL